MKKSQENIRNTFNQRFQERAIAEQIDKTNLCSWPYSFYHNDNFIARWLSEELLRVMRVDESDDDIFKIDYVVDKSGVDYEYGDLLIVTNQTDEKVELIFEIYKLWFVEQKSTEEMEQILDKLCQTYNSD